MDNSQKSFEIIQFSCLSKIEWKNIKFLIRLLDNEIKVNFDFDCISFQAIKFNVKVT